MKVPPFLCWVVVNSVPYHEARFRAAAEAARLRLCMVQLTELDSFRVLQPPPRRQSFHRHTLFPHTPLSRIRGRDMARRLHACLDELGPSVVCINGWSFGGSIAALSWCLPRQVPVIVMSESTASDEPRRWWKETVKRRIIRLCSAALVGGSPHASYMRTLGMAGERIFTGYDVVDNEHFRTGAELARRFDGDLRARLALPARYFMSCSRFTPKKNLFRLLGAYARYSGAAGPAAWSLVVVGDGELRNELVSLRDRLGLGGRVQFRGPRSYDELPSFYGLAGALVHASTTEQWGLVVNEAMAAGLPVLVSDRCGCAADLVEPGVNGRTFDPYDEDGLAVAMRDIAAEDRDRRSMGRASQKIVACWSPDRFAESLARAAEAALRATRPKAAIVDRAMLRMMEGR